MDRKIQYAFPGSIASLIMDKGWRRVDNLGSILSIIPHKGIGVRARRLTRGVAARRDELIIAQSGTGTTNKGKRHATAIMRATARYILFRYQGSFWKRIRKRVEKQMSGGACAVCKRSCNLVARGRTVTF